MKLGEQPIIHPLLMRSLANRFPSYCVIGNVTVTQDAANQPVNTFTANPILDPIPCYVQPSSGAENRTPGQTVELNQWVIGLGGYYPTITQDDNATVNGEIYNIIRVVSDEMKSATYLTCELVT